MRPMPRVRGARRFVRFKNLRRRPGSQNETAIRCRSILFLRDCHGDMWARTWVICRPSSDPRRILLKWPAEALQANRETDAFFGRLKDDEGRGLAGAQLPEQIVIHNHLSNAATRQTAEEAGSPNFCLVDL